MRQMTVNILGSILQSRHAAAFFGKILIGGKGLENFGLSQRQIYFFVVFCVVDDEVFNLDEISMRLMRDGVGG